MRTGPGMRLCVGYSGGLDSSVLLHALALLRGGPISPVFQLSAVHVHHGLSPHADAWAAHCQDVCRALDVPLEIRRVSVDPRGEGLEAAARKARYAVYARQPADAVLLAHHADDQAETVLLQLRRGASARGLAAMPECRALADGLWLWRPLLSQPRAALLEHARQHGLAWVEDDSNADTRLARNRLRHGLLAQWSVAGSDAESGLAWADALRMLAAQSAEWSALLDALADLDARQAGMAGWPGNPPPDLPVRALHALDPARARNLLRRFLELHGLDVRRDALLEAARQVREAAPERRPAARFGALTLLRQGDVVTLAPTRFLRPAPAWDCPWQGESACPLPEGGLVAFTSQAGGFQLAPGCAHLRRRVPGDRMRLGAGRPERLLKDLLREAGIPAWQRPWLPVLEVAGRVAWVAGLGAAADAARGNAQLGGWAISWQPPW